MWILKPTDAYRLGGRQVVAGTLIAGEPVQSGLSATFYSPEGQPKELLIRGTAHFNRPQPVHPQEWHYSYEGPEILPEELGEGALVSDVGYDDALRLAGASEKLSNRR